MMSHLLATWTVLVFLTALWLPSCDGNSGGQPPYELQSLVFSADDDSLHAHERFGRAMGSTFASGIQARFDAWKSLKDSLLPALKTPAGSRLYNAFLSLHNETFPQYIAEMNGVAQGAGLPFELVFIAQIQQEFAAQLHREVGQTDDAIGKAVASDHCSDYMMCSATRCVGAHNEDGDEFNINRTFVVDARFGAGGLRFKAFVYMGELPSGAFGVNSHGIGFTLNWVGPPPSTRPGLGRGFISRSLLDVRDNKAALSAAIRPGQSGGHNIQLFDFCRRGIVNVEIAQERYGVRPISDVPFFHANQFESLVVINETFKESSPHRLRRVAELPAPQGREDMLQVLGDQEDRHYPVFHDVLSHERGELSDWTMATAVFDVDNKTVEIMQGNPGLDKLHETWDIHELMKGGECDNLPSFAHDQRWLTAFV
eukprot:TRINITY_DN47202_c0_g1_i1.p1 TRINITY_DN47202_c0_g1~~TRINITY_DN47202_c0_g1_i1.p1  ORF type:complete len:426 (-),score=47.63 TRINITY_DN47202_c0_g1_i1:273-1550(-)